MKDKHPMPMHGQPASDMQGQDAGPDPNFYWVQTGADYVLVGTSTGVIAQVMLAH